MPIRRKGETGYFHATVRSAGKIPLFEDDEDRKAYLRIMRAARDAADVRILAWVLMTDHVHIIIDCKDNPESLSSFMYFLDKKYSVLFNKKTGRSGHLYKGSFWSKPISTDSQLIATVHYVHMNPEKAGIAPMRTYRWSSYQEYAGKRWVVDTSTILTMFGSFEDFDAYKGSSENAVRQQRRASHTDEEVLALALEYAGCSSSDELRSLQIAERNRIIKALRADGVAVAPIARVFGVGISTVSRSSK